MNLEKFKTIETIIWNNLKQREYLCKLGRIFFVLLIIKNCFSFQSQTLDIMRIYTLIKLIRGQNNQADE